jgi:hypothetical protein
MRNHDMTKTHALSFRVEPELKVGLERAAQADRRSLSSLIEKILAEWLENHEATPARDMKPSGGGTVSDNLAGGSGAEGPAKPTRSAAPNSPVSEEVQLRASRENRA